MATICKVSPGLRVATGSYEFCVFSASLIKFVFVLMTVERLRIFFNDFFPFLDLL